MGQGQVHSSAATCMNGNGALPECLESSCGLNAGVKPSWQFTRKVRVTQQRSVEMPTRISNNYHHSHDWARMLLRSISLIKLPFIDLAHVGMTSSSLARVFGSQIRPVPRTWCSPREPRNLLMSAKRHDVNTTRILRGILI